MMRRNCCSASSIPSAVQRRHISPVCQRLTLRLVRRQISIIDSQGFGRLEHSFQIASDPKPRERECLLEALVERASGAGMRAFELGSERVQLIERSLVVRVGPGLAETTLERRPTALRELLEHVAFFVADTALDRRVLAEDVPDRFA